jgi:ABC-2 type transport system permease protein
MQHLTLTPPVTTRSRPHFGEYLARVPRIILNETAKRLLILIDYKFNLLTQLLVLALIFIGATFFLGHGHFDQQQLPAQLLGFIVMFYARIAILETSRDMISEASAGTLEQMYMSPLPSELLLLGRVFALLISTTLMMVLTIGGLALLLNIHLPLNWAGLLILLITLAGLFGFTLALSGAALIFKQIDALADMIQNLLLFATGALVPISLFPNWLAVIAQTLPITQGIVVLRAVLLYSQSLSAVWANGSLLYLLIHSSLYLLGGWLIFKISERYARRRGSLGQY